MGETGSGAQSGRIEFPYGSEVLFSPPTNPLTCALKRGDIRQQECSPPCHAPLALHLPSCSAIVCGYIFVWGRICVWVLICEHGELRRRRLFNFSSLYHIIAPHCLVQITAHEHLHLNVLWYPDLKRWILMPSIHSCKRKPKGYPCFRKVLRSVEHSPLPYIPAILVALVL